MLVRFPTKTEPQSVATDFKVHNVSRFDVQLSIS